MQMLEQDLSTALCERVTDAANGEQALQLQGSGSKSFYGEAVSGKTLELSGHAGIVSYEPTELVLTARAGTSLAHIEQLLAENGQQMAFDPPQYGQSTANAPSGTLGGAIASGLAGPARPWSGAPRDHLLGVRIIDGLGRDLSFGGQVMKNVAGYDVSRLMAGALGTLGVLLEVSIKVLPAPINKYSCSLELSREQAQAKIRDLNSQPVPLAGALYDGERLHIRLAGASSSLRAWADRIGGEAMTDEGRFWQQLRDHQLPFFAQSRTLWRLSLAADAPELGCEEQAWLDWGGAQRWVYSDQDGESIRQAVSQYGGHATLFRGELKETPRFHPLPAPLLQLHQRLKQQFDPKNILNPGALFKDTTAPAS